MKKQLLVAAIAAAIAAPVSMTAAADATIYGKVRVNTSHWDRSDTGQPGALQDTWGMGDESSRLGIKGSEDLGNGLKAIYKMEFGVNVGDGFGKGNFWSQRNAYVGLAGGWGTLLMGRHDTPYKIGTSKVDLFGDTIADGDGTPGATGSGRGTHVGFFDQKRVDGAIAYVSPSFAGFTLAGAIVQTVNNSNGPNDFQDAYSLTGMYSNGPWFASLSYENIDKVAFAGNDDDTKWAIGLGMMNFNNFTLTGLYEDHNSVNAVKDQDYKSWQISAAYDFGNNRVKGMYGQYDGDKLFSNNDFSGWALGYQYNFSKRTDVQFMYRKKDMDKSYAITGLQDESVFSLQLDHSF